MTASTFRSSNQREFFEVLDSHPVKFLECLSYLFAIINADGFVNHGIQEQKPCLKMGKALDLEPFAFIVLNNKEENATARPDVANDIMGMKHPYQIQRCIPIKRTCDCLEESSGNTQILESITLENIISHSHLRNYLNSKRYFELGNNICKLLNDDLSFKPQLRFFSARIFLVLLY